MKIACFPFTPDVEVLLRHQSQMENNEICSIISFREDLARLQKLEQSTGLLCTVSIADGLRDAEALMLLNNDLDLRWDKYYSCIDHAHGLGIPVYASGRLITQIPDPVRKSLLIRMEDIYAPKDQFADSRLFEIETPIIAIMGIGENCGKFECQIELKELLDSLGYRAGWLCSNPLGAYMGMNALPDFLFDPQMSFPDKVIKYNHFVYDFCATYDPDVLVIGVPSGIISLSEKDTNYFAEIPLIVSSALRVDYGILTFYYLLEPQNEFLDQLCKLCLNKYQIRVPFLYMSRQMLTFEQEGFRMKPLFLSDEYISKHLSRLGSRQDVMTPFTDNSELFRSLIACLQENIETV